MSGRENFCPLPPAKACLPVTAWPVMGHFHPGSVCGQWKIPFNISKNILPPASDIVKRPVQARLVAMRGNPSVFHFSDQIILVRSGDPDFDKIAGHQVPSGLHKQCSIHTGSIHICA